MLVPEGTGALGWPTEDSTLVLGGAVKFADEKAALSVMEQLPLRIPFLTKASVLELRLGRDAFHVEGKTLSLAARVTGPANVLEGAIEEALRAIATKAKSGALTMHGLGERMEIQAGGKRTFGPRHETAPANSFPAIAPIDPRKTPLAAKPAATNGKKGAAAEPPALEGHAKVSGAKRLPSGCVAVWGGAVATIYTSELAPLHSFPLKDRPDEYAWPVSGVFELGHDRVAVTHESWSDVDVLDLEARSRQVLRTSHSSVHGAAALDKRLVTWGYAGKISVHEGLEERLVIDAGDSLNTVAVLPDKTAIAIASDKATRWNLETGAKVADLGKKTHVHVLTDGSFLLENYGVFEKFTIDKGNPQEIVEVDPRTFAVFSQHHRQVHLVDRASGKTKKKIDAQQKYIGGVVRVGAQWATHGKSTPGLNERFGFDGTVRLWSEDWTMTDEIDTKSPVRSLIPLGGAWFALLFDDALKSKELHVYEGAKSRATYKAKKPIAGALVLEDGRVLYWSKDGIARIISRG
jgi:hypothetical protein